VKASEVIQLVERERRENQLSALSVYLGDSATAGTAARHTMSCSSGTGTSSWRVVRGLSSSAEIFVDCTKRYLTYMCKLSIINIRVIHGLMWNYIFSRLCKTCMT
jgi:hypothetical protein